MTTILRYIEWVLISWLLGRRLEPDEWAPHTAEHRPLPPAPPLVGYFTPAAGIPARHKRRDAVAQLRDIGLDKLEMLASRSLGPVDPRLLGRKSDGTAVFQPIQRRFSVELQPYLHRDQATLLSMYRAVRP